MDMMTALIVVGLIAMVVAGAGFACAQPRHFIDRDADGAPDATPEEIAQASAHDAWTHPEQRREGKTEQ